LWKARVNDPENVAPPGGESYHMLFQRLRPAWERVLEEHAGQRVAIVGHNGSLRVLLCHLLGAPIANARRLLIGNCSVTKVVVENGDEPKTIPDGRLEGPPVVVQYINNVCHLEGI
jgi:broad specificity phosphatase PhoE